MNLDKLKEAARKFEQREEWRRAIDVYLQAIREAEEAGEEGTQDPGLYNRVGDLQLKAGDSLAALRAYEQAAELYADQGFFNNAIALCGKILRVNPSRTATYLRLAQLHARKNFVGEAKRNLGEYLERMNGVGQTDEAFSALKLFADHFSANPDIRLMLVEMLRASSRNEEAREQLEKLAGELEARGDTTAARKTRERLQSIDGTRASSERGGGGVQGAPSNDLVFLDTGMHETHQGTGDRGQGSGVDETEPEPASASMEPDAGLVHDPLFERTLGEAAAIELQLPTDEHFIFGDTGGGARSVEFESGDSPSSEFEASELPAADFDAPVADAEVESETAETTSEEATPAPPPAEAEPAVFDLEEPDPPAPPDVLSDPVLLQLNEALAAADFANRGETAVRGWGGGDLPRQPLEAGDPAAGAGAGVGGAGAGAGLSRLEERLRELESESRWEEALGVCGELIRLEPSSIPRFQKQVELAYYAGRRPVLVSAYVELADALVRAGAVEHAAQVYRRVLDHDESNEAAHAALAMLETEQVPTPTAEQPATAQDFVNLGELILGEELPRDTRMRVGRESQTEDEDEAFQEALADFKRGIEANLDAEDFQAHYDLGIAFKEMGLVDEAIAEFQKALRSSEGRLRTSEQLGIAFFDQGQYGIAEAVLRRAVNQLPGSEDEKIGLLYWLGRALESQGKGREALPLYEQALAVDIRFLDVRDRVRRLAAELAS